MVEDDATAFAFDILFANLALLGPWLLLNLCFGGGRSTCVSNIHMFKEEV
jgi:hypothetical protein